MKQTTIVVSPVELDPNGFVLKGTNSNDGTVITVEVTHKQFNWLTVLEALCDGAEIDSDSKSALEKRANNWPTCACGQLCSALPRYGTGCPMDTKMFCLGLDFNYHIRNRNWLSAFGVFKQIEMRATHLLNQ